jgi:hypothetical protein
VVARSRGIARDRCPSRYPRLFSGKPSACWRRQAHLEYTAMKRKQDSQHHMTNLSLLPEASLAVLQERTNSGLRSKPTYAVGIIRHSRGPRVPCSLAFKLSISVHLRLSASKILSLSPCLPGLFLWGYLMRISMKLSSLVTQHSQKFFIPLVELCYNFAAFI